MRKQRKQGNGGGRSTEWSERPFAHHLPFPSPPPRPPGNHHPSSSLCLHDELFKTVVIEHGGWDFIDEGRPDKPKRGFVSTQPGSKLRIQINTTRDHSGKPVPTILAYLKSYDGMGMAVAR